MHRVWSEKSEVYSDASVTSLFGWGRKAKTGFCSLSSVETCTRDTRARVHTARHDMARTPWHVYATQHDTARSASGALSVGVAGHDLASKRRRHVCNPGELLLEHLVRDEVEVVEDRLVVRLQRPRPPHRHGRLHIVDL
eukprot:scaffold107412_cov70-Phaeocystis_antarctica.AAC.1